MIVAAFAGFALIILLLFEIGTGNQGVNEHVGMLNEGVPNVIQVPDWTIFDDVSGNEPTHLATSEFVDRVRTSGTTLTPDPSETFGRVMRELVPLPRPRPKRP